MSSRPVAPATAWRPLLRGLTTLLCLVLVPLARAESVRGLYVGNEFYPPNAATELTAKQSGFNRLFLFTLHVQNNGDITYNDTVVVKDGTYVGDPTWGARLAAVKNDGRINRIEACIGSYGSGAFDNIKTYINSQGTGPSSLMYRNFLAFKNATGVDAFQYDDEKTYDTASAVAFGKMLGGLGVKVTLCPYTQQTFWVNVRKQLGSLVDAIYLQCYDGGQYNDPAQWNQAFGGFKVFPGLWGNSSPPDVVLSRMRNWQTTLGMNGAFMWLNGTLQWDSMDMGHDLQMALDPTPFFLLVNRITGKSLDLIDGNVNDGAVTNQWSYNYADPNQRWALFPTENGDHFKILSWVSGRSLCVVLDSLDNGAQIHAYRYTGNNPAQQWDLVDGGQGWFKIRNVKSGKILDVSGYSQADGAKIEQTADSNGLNQYWRLQPQGDYALKASTGKYVCVANRGSTNGNAVVQYTGEGNPWFQWRWQHVGNGFYRVSSLNALTRVLGVVGGSTTAGAACQLFDYNTGNAGEQKVRLKPLLNGRFKFYFGHDGLSWDIPNGQGDNYVPLQQLSDNNNAWQQFSLERLFTTVPVPAAPTGINANLADGKATLSWGAAAYANGYNVKRATTSGGTYTTVATGVAATSYVDTMPSPAGRYYYVVSAVSDTGEGINSAEVAVADAYQQWAQQNGLVYGAPGSGFGESTDGSGGVSNGVRYAVPGGLKVAPDAGSGASTVTLDLRTDPGLQAALWTSPDLVTWMNSGLTGTPASDQTGVAAGFKRMIYQDAATGGPAPAQRFYRLQLTR